MWNIFRDTMNWLMKSWPLQEFCLLLFITDVGIRKTELRPTTIRQHARIFNKEQINQGKISKKCNWCYQNSQHSSLLTEIFYFTGIEPALRMVFTRFLQHFINHLAWNFHLTMSLSNGHLKVSQTVRRTRQSYQKRSLNENFKSLEFIFRFAADTSYHLVFLQWHLKVY